VSKPEYDCECEDFCLPGKSECCITYDECGHKQKCYTPTCGCVRTRVKLIKREKKEQVQTHKCVVENLCPRCSVKCGAKPLPQSTVAGYLEQMAVAAGRLTPASHVEPQSAPVPDAPSQHADDVGTEQTPSLWQRAIAPFVNSD
jgi:hypothetical protein